MTPREPDATQTYTLEEALAISNALNEARHQREQLIFCIAAFAGLRPGEIAGLKWPDICETEERQIGALRWTGWIDIRRTFVSGMEGKTKTDQSGSEETPAPVPMIGELSSMFVAWRTMCGNPTQG